MADPNPHTPASGALKIEETDMSNKKIIVTVTVPEGLRAVVVMTDYVKGEAHSQEATVLGGTSQDFFADGIRRVTIKEGFPQFIADALDRKPDSE